MEISIQSLHFDASKQLVEFINKKVSKLDQYVEKPVAAQVTLRVTKSEDRENKEASLKVLLPEGELFASKQTDTFEESVALVVDAIIKQIGRYKEKKATELTKKN
ncbi:MAG: HPF/RaiA family ribosome-associated protein [Bacteroidales bacterium]